MTDYKQKYVDLLSQVSLWRMMLDQIDDGEMPISYYAKLAEIATKIDKYLRENKTIIHVD